MMCIIITQPPQCANVLCKKFCGGRGIELLSGFCNRQSRAWDGHLVRI